VKGDRGALDRLAGLVFHLNRERAGGAGSGRVHRAVPFHNLNLKNGDLRRRRARESEKQGCPHRGYSRQPAFLTNTTVTLSGPPASFAA
jgi:hypothetical protein